MNRRRNINITKSLKDYIVPIIGLLLIVLLVFSVFTGDNNDDLKNQIRNENQIPLEVKVDNDFTEAYIIYAGENKKRIEEKVSLYKGEKVQVKDGQVTIDFLSVGDFVLGKLGELKYEETGDLSLDSGYLWVNSSTKLDINMKFASMSIGENSHLSLSQNEAGSTIHLLSGEVEVRNLVGESSVLSPGQKITISSLNASNKDLDLSILKEDLDDFFKKTDWYIKNNGDFYLVSNSLGEETGTGSIKSNTYKGSELIVFDNLTDEAYVSKNSLEITGKYFDENITKILLNGKEAKINKEAKTFTFTQVDTSLSENDLVFKIMDDSNDLLQKFVYVVYYKSGTTTGGNSPFNVKTYEVDGSQFTFTSPAKSGTFTTTTGFVTIRGSVLAEGIADVSVNGYTLSSFNGSTWRYHADADRNNLKDGTNIYEIKYFNTAGTVVYKNTFTIIKKEAVIIPVVPEEEVEDTKTYSDEVL